MEENNRLEEERKEEEHQHQKHHEKGEIKIPAKANEAPGRKKNVHVPATSTCKCSIF